MRSFCERAAARRTESRCDRIDSHAARLPLSCAPACLEEVFILQGGYRDQLGERRAGEYILNDAGSAHAPVALEGEECIMLAVAHGGIELLR